MLTATAESTEAPCRHVLAAHASSASFVAFRVAFGVLAAAGQFRFVARGWVEEFLLAPDVHLTYAGFGWVRPLPTSAMYVIVLGLGVLGLLIAAGVATRPAAALFAVGFAYVELMEAALYLNHYWFMTLAAVVLAVVPGPQGDRVPVVSIWALRGQLAVVYVFIALKFT